MTDLVFFYGTLMSGFKRPGRSRIDAKLTPIGRGTIGAALMAGLLTKILTGVFDPPPDHAAVPLTYLLEVVALTAAAGAAAAKKSP